MEILSGIWFFFSIMLIMWLLFFDGFSFVNAWLRLMIVHYHDSHKLKMAKRQADIELVQAQTQRALREIDQL